jgi:hypothetical protein
MTRRGFSLNEVFFGSMSWLITAVEDHKKKRNVMKGRCLIRWKKGEIRKQSHDRMTEWSK